ncbi:MAG: hypothetical protein WC408_03370 [Candidatus Micrarchaeia archaeon]|jgi:uncharacterized protein (UPF0333 family)
MDQKGQVSVEMLLIIGVLVALAIAFLGQVRGTASDFSGQLNHTSQRAVDLLNETSFEP